MGLKIKIDKKTDDRVENSKFFGQAFVPEKWLYEGEFSPTEVFFCQINLEEAQKAEKTDLLPQNGFLYFFFDFEEKPTKGVVRYAASPDACVFFNEGADSEYDVETEYPISFKKAEDFENGVFSKDKKLVDGEICLLKFTPDSIEDIDFLSGVGGSICFVIRKDDLSKGRFDKAFLLNLT